MSNARDKAPAAFRTIGEVSAELDIPQHILRFWEGKFTQLRPVKRSGNRRYYRAEDVALIQRIDRLLNHEGYTIAGVQRLLGKHGGESGHSTENVSAAVASSASDKTEGVSLSGDARFDRAALQTIRDILADALERSPPAAI